MNVLILGASGMIGQSVLREYCSAADVEQIFVVGRSLLPESMYDTKKLTQLLCHDFYHISQLLDSLPKIDACFCCLGQSSFGMTEKQYLKITYDLTLTVAKELAAKFPSSILTYVSGSGTDTSENGKIMWARVKGKTENALLQCGFSSVYLFRPGFIQPLNGIHSRTFSYRMVHLIMKPFFPVLRYLFPKKILTTTEVGQAMLNVARKGYPSAVLEIEDILELAQKK